MEMFWNKAIYEQHYDVDHQEHLCVDSFILHCGNFLDIGKSK